MAFSMTFLLVLLSAFLNQAYYFPVGPQINVPLATVLDTNDGGWYPCAVTSYKDILSITDFPDCDGYDILMLSCSRDFVTLDLLAWGNRTDVLYPTGGGTDYYYANGVNWYYQAGQSMGFVAPGDIPHNNPIDRAEDFGVTTGLEFRLSWNLDGNFGYRCGSRINLNDFTDIRMIWGFELNACLNNPCGEHTDCYDLVAPALDDEEGRRCECQNGYTGNATENNCTDVNACINYPCGSGTVCVDISAGDGGDDSEGGRNCSCDIGFENFTAGLGCTDINACESHSCGVGAECQDVPAPALGTTDGRYCNCTTGYHNFVEGTGCSDINACDILDCGSGGDCSDVPAPALGDVSGRNCSCHSGYAIPDHGNQCADINACISHACGSGTVCVDILAENGGDDSDAGRTCSCDVGFENFTAGQGCVGINACVSHGCGSAAACSDLGAPGLDNSAGRTCTCQSGFSNFTEGVGCTDINACINHACGSGTVCVDISAANGGLDNDAGRTCSCVVGYENFTPGSGCVEINACVHHGCGVGTVCSDVKAPALDDNAGRTCSCDTGYHNFIAPSGGCTEINACVNHGCGSGLGAVCTDINAPALDDETGRTCGCSSGYENYVAPTGCTDINACVHNGCGNGTVCTDRPAPAHDDTNGRSCACGIGYESFVAGKGCSDINACTNHPCAVTVGTCQDLPAPALEGTTGRTCVQVCQPTTCKLMKSNCGFRDNGCGSALDCGKCSGIEICGGGTNPLQCGFTPDIPSFMNVDVDTNNRPTKTLLKKAVLTWTLSPPNPLLSVVDQNLNANAFRSAPSDPTNPPTLLRINAAQTITINIANPLNVRIVLYLSGVPSGSYTFTPAVQKLGSDNSNGNWAQGLSVLTVGAGKSYSGIVFFAPQTTSVKLEPTATASSKTFAFTFAVTTPRIHTQLKPWKPASSTSQIFLQANTRLGLSVNVSTTPLGTIPNQGQVSLSLKNTNTGAIVAHINITPLRQGGVCSWTSDKLPVGSYQCTVVFPAIGKYAESNTLTYKVSVN